MVGRASNNFFEVLKKITSNKQFFLNGKFLFKTFTKMTKVGIKSIFEKKRDTGSMFVRTFLGSV